MSNDEFIPYDFVQIQTNKDQHTNPIKDIENEKAQTKNKSTVKFICTKTKRGNFTVKKKQKFLNSDNSYKEALKTSILLLLTFIKETFNIQLKRINLRKIVKSIKKNKLLFNYKLYQILCVDKNNQNKNILLKFKEKNENYKKLYFYLLTRNFKDLFDNYYKNNNRIKMSSNGKDMEDIDSFPTFNEALKKKKQYYKEKVHYKKKYSAEKIDKKIDEFKRATDIVFSNFKDHTARPERNPCKEHEIEIIKDFDNFDLEKNISIEFSSASNSDDIFNDQIMNPITSNNNSLDSTNSDNRLTNSISRRIIIHNNIYNLYDSDNIVNKPISRPITSNNNRVDFNHFNDMINDSLRSLTPSNNTIFKLSNSNNILNDPIRHPISSNNNDSILNFNNSNNIINESLRSLTPSNNTSFEPSNSNSILNDPIRHPISSNNNNSILNFNNSNNIINDLLRSPTPSNNTSFEPSNSNSILNDPIRHPISSNNNNSILNFNNSNNIINAPLRSPTPSNN